MKAIAKVAPKKGVELVEKPMPEMGINDVLIKIKKTAICGTDVLIYEWNSWAQEEIKPPLTIGHEYVGEVVEVGLNVKSVKVGERKSYEKKRAIAEGRANGACVRSERRGTARLRFA